jgi:hypothetical protein
MLAMDYRALAMRRRVSLALMSMLMLLVGDEPNCCTYVKLTQESNRVTS